MVGSPTTNYWDDDGKITLNPPARLLDQGGQWIPLTMGPVANTLAFLRRACEADGEVATIYTNARTRRPFHAPGDALQLLMCRVAVRDHNAIKKSKASTQCMELSMQYRIFHVGGYSFPKLQLKDYEKNFQRKKTGGTFGRRLLRILKVCLKD